MDYRKAVMEAVKGESEGRQLYLAMSEKTEDAGAKEVFRFLADEEKLHMDTLLEVLKSQGDHPHVDTAKMRPLIEPERLRHPIFSAEFKRRIKDKHFEVSALSIAMRLEKDAVATYAALAATAPNEPMRKFFETLSAWEGRHYDALYRELQSIEAEYYDKNMFAPF